MTSTNLSPKQLNFAQISIVCVDILKQCLIDILDIHIKPTDLSKEIHLSQSLKGGKDKLNSEQRDLCCFSSLRVPDYSKFDVTLLYRLIRNLCPTLKPSKDWGKEPKTTDLTIGDDIERIRLFRNKHYAHAESAKIPDSEFTDLWNEGKSLIHRIQIFTTANGCTTDYGLKLTNISGRMIKYEEYTSYVNLFRAISIERNVEVTCGETAQFKADIRLEDSAFLSVSWEKVDGSSRKHIDISCEKYRGSTGRQLNIHSVCKEDEGEYQAVISRNLDHKIFSNIGFLQTQGVLPLLHNLTVSTTKDEIRIHYSHTVLENSPRINDIKWTKNKTPLDLTNNKYCGGNLDDSFLRITCPSIEDSGEYSCTVTNAVGWVSRLVMLDKPRAKISTNTPVVHGLETRFSCLISSCPSPEKIEWQKSCDENIFHRIDINELKYHGSNEDPSSPVLCLPKTTFDDQQFYRIAVRNKIGECMSNTHFLKVVGNRPNITNAICTTKDRSVRLNCDVFLYDKSPALQDVYWTKNEQKLDIQGSGGKYSGVSPDDPSLTINNVNKHDAGNYQLTAINSVGPTKSDDIVLGIPDIVLTRINRNKDGSQCFTMTISSLPAPFFVQWSMEDKKSGTSGTLQQINVNAEEYKGTSNSFPRPVLVVKHNESLKNYSFRIQVENVFGFTEKIIPDETNPMFFKSEENTVNVGNLSRNFKGGGRNIRFGKLFDELAEKFPDAKISRLKDLIQNSYELEDVKSLERAKSARDCFRILRSEDIFSPENVMFLQHLLKTTECEELETKCIEYAKMHDAMYYHEKPPDNGYKNVHFHVVANIGCYGTEKFTEIRETVAAIVGCTIEEVLVNGYLHSASFILVLSIKNYFVNKLLALKRKDKDKLCKLSIDYFKIGSIVIRLKFLRDKDEHTTVYPYQQGSGELSEKPSFSDYDLMESVYGNHLEVAEVLVGFGAEVNQRIVEDFPDTGISSKLVKNCISEQQMEYTLEAGYSEELVHIANYSHKELGGFQDFWISDYKNILVELNISNNHISRLPANIPWDLPSLKTFNASCNKISAIRVDPQCTILCKRLENILLQENQLEELCYKLFQLPELRYLNVAHNKMRYMVKSNQRYEDWRVLNPGVTDKPEWSCTKLRCLNASYNNLEMLPTEISSCSGLVELDASNNKLVAFPSPWECKLSTLNLSHNVMVRFAPSVELFWCATLKKLHLDYNQLEEMTESIVKLCCLQVLNLSNNKINVLQRPEVWDCKMLQILDLSGNRLGIPSGDTPLPTTKSKLLPRRRSRLSSCSENVSFRIALPSFLAHCLNELNLSDNCLDCVPPSVCQLVSLQTLDISNNSAIKSLPKELGRLSQCNSLNIQGTGIPGGEVSLSAVDCHFWTKKYIQGLNEKLRQSKGYYRLKLVVVGKKDKGKTAITNLLGCKSNFEIHGSGIRRMETTLCPKKKSGIMDKLISSNRHRIRNETGQSKRLPIELCVWDLAGDECYKATHHCFFTPNSLYLVVWDLWSLAKDMEKIGKLLYSIEARNPHSKVIIAATFLDKNNSPTRDKQVSQIKRKLLEAFGSASERYGGLCSQLEDDDIIPMSCITGAGVSELRDAMYNTACNMKELGNKSLGTRYLLGRSIPNSYLLIEKEIFRELEDRIRDGKPPFLVQRELYGLIENIPGCDVEVPQEVPEVVKFLVTSGAMLHFNEQLQGLNNVFYLDPTWLCDVLSQVLIDSSLCQSMKGGKIALSTVQEMYLQDSRFPNENVPQYIQLLEQFEIALKVELDRKLFIPSHLHANPGMDLQFHGRDGKRVCRLYQLAFIPNGLWSRLLFRIMCRIELLANDWVLRSSVRIKPGKSFYRINSKTNKGLKINNKDIIYWEDGMFLRHEMGHFMLESVQVSQRERYITHGILITVQSLEEDYSIMGMIVDVVEDLLSDHYPGLMDYDMLGRPIIQRVAICPVCYTITSCVLPSNLDHFTVEHCARLLLSGDTALCRRGTKVPLSQLVPELLMQELPRKFLLDSEKLQVDPSNKKAYLGSGVTGSVFKGKYGDVDIAVKYYHGAPSMSGKHSLDSSHYSGWNISSVERNKPLHDNDDDENLNDYMYVNVPYMHLDMEASRIKAFRAFMEMRQEADVTSKLDHPCVVSFVGISIRPDLLMCQELAPLGSLRRVLDNEIEGREPFNKYRDKDKVFLPVFNKEINFKLVHQIVRGLDYLHKHGIIYRDLKSDNILVTSLDPEAPVNVKLSDSGISKFNTSGGTEGLVGTTGYQAPEIMGGLAYDEKVDIFSFSMVLYEILSGKRPYYEYKNMEAKRPNLQDSNIDPHFPMLERLMELCWHQDATQRPSAKDILTTSHMMSADFLAQHKHFPWELEEVDFVTSVTEHGGVKRQVWAWEGSGDDRCYHILDATMCTYQAFRKPLPGATVTCMDKIGKQIWIGTEDEQIEVFGQHGVGHLSSLKKLDNLGATPTCIEYVKNEELGKKVYILLGDGQLRIYQYIIKPEVNEGEEVNLRHQFNWHLKKILRLSKRTASCLVYVMETEELWCGCGSDIVIVSNRTEMIERRIEINKECQAILENKLPDIVKLVHMDSRIWALLANSSELLEFDTEMGILTHNLKCDQINPHKLVVSKYISNSSVQVQAMSISRRFSVSADDSSGEKTSSGEFDKWFDESSSSAKAHADSENNPPPPIPERCVSVSDPQHPALSPPLPPRRPTMAKKSQTLPARASPLSSGLPIPRNRHLIVNSVAGVGDSIWVGRSTGDILIINVKSNAQCQHGCVMAVMKNHCDKQHIIHEVKKLVTVENLIFSVIKADSKFTEITAWEAYDAAKIQKLEQIWACPKSMVSLRNSNADNVIDVGEV